MTVPGARSGAEPDSASTGAIDLLLVASGSAVGACARWALSLAAPGPGDFAFNLLLVNVAGSVLVGLFAALAGTDGESGWRPSTRLFAINGLCAGFTTFSLFGVEWQQSLATDGVQAAAWLLAVSATLWMLGVAAGFALGSWLARRRRPRSTS